MSTALYKFLQKAVLEGKPGAKALQAKYTARARHAIIRGIAEVKGGGGQGRFRNADDFYRKTELGDTGKEMLLSAGDRITGGLDIADGEARDLYVKWLGNKP